VANPQGAAGKPPEHNAKITGAAAASMFDLETAMLNVTCCFSGFILLVPVRFMGFILWVDKCCWYCVLMTMMLLLLLLLLIVLLYCNTGNDNHDEYR
jgi:hypothetical protein